MQGGDAIALQSGILIHLYRIVLIFKFDLNEPIEIFKATKNAQKNALCNSDIMRVMAD